MPALLLTTLAAAAGVSVATVVSLDRWRITNHKPNHWTLTGLMNVLRLRGRFVQAMKLIDGTLNSCYRSPTVNAKIGGSPTSDHMYGRAIDTRPGKAWSVERASREVYARAVRGELGDVRQVIWEPTWVHIGWRSAGELRGQRVEFLKKTDTGFVKVV